MCKWGWVYRSKADGKLDFPVYNGFMNQEETKTSQKTKIGEREIIGFLHDPNKPLSIFYPHD